MAEVTGNPPVEYRNVGVESAPNPTAGWQAQPETAQPAAGPGGAGSIARQLTGEFIGTFALIFIAVSVTYWFHRDYLSVGIASGITAGVLVFAFSNLGSGQFNPAITLGLMLGGKLKFSRALLIVPTQITAAILACFLLSSFLGPNQMAEWILPDQKDPNEPGPQTATMLQPMEAATPTIPRRGEFIDAVANDMTSQQKIKYIEAGKPYPLNSFRQYEKKNSQRVSVLQAVVLEAMFTFLWGLAVFAGMRRGNNAAMAVMVGGAVLVGVLACVTMTGAAMNPVRAFGPALVSGVWDFQIVYWLGPMLGGALAGVICGHFLFPDEEEGEETALAYPRT